MTTDEKEVVSALHAGLADKVGRERFQLWFGPNTQLVFDGQTLTVALPSRFLLDWVRTNFRREIEAVCQSVLGTCPQLDFRIRPSSDDPAIIGASDKKGRVSESGVEHCDKPSSAALSASAVEPSVATVPVATPAVPVARGTVSPSTIETASSTGASRVGRKFATLASFVTGTSNQLAVTCAEEVARRPGSMTPLLIHGPTSVGKTHLLEGIWSATRRRYPRLRAVYLSAEKFTTYFLEALRGSGLPNFRRKYRDVELFILDDLQFLAGKRATQVELLHTVDTLLRNSRQVVFSANRSPAELGELGPELTTRLQSGMPCPIHAPDFITRVGIVGQMAARRDMEVPDDVRQLIASRLTSHARELSGALCRLQATSQAYGRPITRQLAEQALADMFRCSKRVVRLPDIEKAVCEVFEMAPSALHSSRKGKDVTQPRMLAMWLARKHTRAALSEISEFFGRRSHSTVLSAQKRVDGWMAEHKCVALADRTWDIGDAIDEVEQHLQAG